jgi:nitrogen fixation NifU-like protein
MNAGGAQDLRNLYRQIVLEHSRQPHNCRRLEAPDRQATGHNPLCGDKISLSLRLRGDRIDEVAFEGSGCAICIASASMLTDAVQGRTTTAATGLADDFDGMFAHPPGAGPGGDLAALAGVRSYPSRIRCATLPWRTLAAALRSEAGAVSTESEIPR